MGMQREKEVRMVMEFRMQVEDEFEGEGDLGEGMSRSKRRLGFGNDGKRGMIGVGCSSE